MAGQSVLSMSKSTHGALDKMASLLHLKPVCARLAAALALCSSLSFEPAGASPIFKTATLGGSVYDSIGQSEEVDPLLLYAVSLTESAYNAGVKGFVKPSVYAIRTPDGAIYPKDLDEAKRQLWTAVKAYGARRIDVGLMQINGQHWHRLGLPVFALFNPKVNVRFGARILKEAMRSSPEDLAVGIGRYHSYTPSRAIPYGRRVLQIYSRIKGL